MNKQRLILAGIGHANIGVLSGVQDLGREDNEIVVIHPGRFQYYSGMGPGMLGGSYEPDEIRFPVKLLADRAGARFVEDSVVAIDARRNKVRVAGGQVFAYDVLVINTGSTAVSGLEVAGSGDRALPSLYRSKPISMLLSLRREIERRRTEESLRIVVAGGGPAAVEIAANCATLLSCRGDNRHRDGAVGGQGKVDVIAGRSLLPGLPGRASRKARRALARHGVAVHSRERVQRVVCGGVETTSGFREADIVVEATGIVPHVPADSVGLPISGDGGLVVTENLNVSGHPAIFAGGDCIRFAPRHLDRVGVYAVREIPVLVNNVRAMLGGKPQEMRPFSPQSHYLLLINLGGERALFWRKVLGLNLIVSGRWVWRLKDRIDRAFMEEYGSERFWQQADTTS